MTVDPRIYQELIGAVDTRVKQHLAQQPRTAYGIVATVDIANHKASVYVSGDAVPSLGFSFPRNRVPSVGARVRVVIDPRGDRYIESDLNSPGLKVDDPAYGYVAVAMNGQNRALIDAGTGASENARMLGYGTDNVATVMLEHDAVNKNVKMKGYGRLRWVPLVSNGYSPYNAATRTTALDAELEMTMVPSDGTVRAVTGTAIMANTVASDSYSFRIRNHGSSAGTSQGVVLYPQVANVNVGSHFIAEVGGTSKRNIRVAWVFGGASTMTAWIQINGYFTDDNV